MRMSLSRQGKKWSKYRCICQAVNSSLCLCSDVGTNKQHRVTFKDLARRNLNGLFSQLSLDRIGAPLYGIGSFNQLRFK